MEMSRDALLGKITALDFFITDLHLYLNTHPTDSEAVEMYNSCVVQVRQLREDYNRSFGMLLANNCVSSTPWQWIDNPWPWQKAFNFKVSEGNS